MVSASCSPDGTQLATGCDNGSVHMPGEHDASLCVHDGKVGSVAFSPSGTQLAIGIGGKDGTVRLWDVLTATCTAALQGHENCVCSLAYRPDGKQLASTSLDGTVKLWDVATAACTATLQGHEGGVFCVAYSPMAGS